jgi:hypothetical protein
MPVTVGGLISATDYNSIRTSLSGVYQTLYGQTLRSTAVTGFSTDGLNANRVTAQRMLQLFLDSQSCFVHQQGSVSTSISPPPIGQTIGANASQTFNQLTGALGTPADSTIQGYNDFESVIAAISNFDGSVSGWPTSSFSLGTPVSSARVTTWGGASQVQSVYHVITVTFASETLMNQYFNAGGSLRFTASLTSGTGAKSTDWATLLTNMGTVEFNKYRITASSGTPTPPGSGGSGFDSLTGSYRQLYIRTGSGVYSDNDYRIEGFRSGAVLRFRLSFNDGDVGTGAGTPPNPIDESVNGTLASFVNTFRPDSSFVYNTVNYTAVSIAAPTVATAVELSTDNGSPPA